MRISNYLKNLKKSFSIIIVPDDTSRESRSKKFTLTRLLIFAVVYSILIAVLGYYFFNSTGIGKSVLPGNFDQSEKTIEEMEKLNERIIFLAKELQLLKSDNQKLKYAMALGDSSLIDSFKVNPDTLRKLYKTPKEGNILGVFINFLQNVVQPTGEHNFFHSSC